MKRSIITVALLLLIPSLFAHAGFFDKLKEQVSDKIEQVVDDVTHQEEPPESHEQSPTDAQFSLPPAQSKASSTPTAKVAQPSQLKGLEYDSEGRIVLRQRSSYEQDAAFKALIAKVALGVFPELFERVPIAFATEAFLTPHELDKYVEKDGRKMREIMRIAQSNFGQEAAAYCDPQRKQCFQGSNAFALRRTKEQFVKQLGPQIKAQAPSLPIQFRSVVALRLEKYDFDKAGFFLGWHTPQQPFHYNKPWELNVYKLHFSPPESRFSRYWYLEAQDAEAILMDESLKTGPDSHRQTPATTVYAATKLQLVGSPAAINGLSPAPGDKFRGVERYLLLEFLDDKVELFADPELQRRLGVVEIKLPPDAIVMSGIPETLSSNRTNELNGPNIAALARASSGNVLGHEVMNKAQAHQLMLDNVYYKATENIPNKNGSYTTTAPLDYAAGYQPFFPPGLIVNETDLLSESGDTLFDEWMLRLIEQHQGRYYVKTVTRMGGKGVSGGKSSEARHVAIAFTPYESRNRSLYMQVTEALRAEGVMATQLAMLPMHAGPNAGDFFSGEGKKREVVLVLPNTVDSYTAKFYEPAAYEKLTGTQEARISLNVDKVRLIPVDQGMDILALHVSPTSVSAYTFGAENRPVKVIEKAFSVAALTPDQIDLRSWEEKQADEKARKQQAYEAQRAETQHVSTLQSEMNSRFQACYEEASLNEQIQCVDRICPELRERSKGVVSVQSAQSLNDACERRYATEKSALERSYKREEEKHASSSRGKRDSTDHRMQRQMEMMTVMSEMKAKLDACHAQPADEVMLCIQKVKTEMQQSMKTAER